MAGLSSRDAGCIASASVTATESCARKREGVVGEQGVLVGPAGVGPACSPRCSCGPSLIWKM